MEFKIDFLRFWKRISLPLKDGPFLIQLDDGKYSTEKCVTEKKRTRPFFIKVCLIKKRQSLYFRASNTLENYLSAISLD